jgi:hypothetical protein
MSLDVKPSSTSSKAFARIFAGGGGEALGSVMPNAAAADDRACTIFVGVSVG